MSKGPVNKGNRRGAGAEESLRLYFLQSHCFVVRGAPLRSEGTDITDVDLWLYSRPSATARHRAIVDVKKKNRSQALARVLWVKGLQAILRVDQAIVATTDARGTVSRFGAAHGVTVLDGSFLRLVGKAHPSGHRMSEEEFLGGIRTPTDKRHHGWWARLQEARERLLHDLSFEGCNAWLNDAAFFLEASRAGKQRESTAVRLTYLSLSYFLISLDFIFSTLAFEVNSERRRKLLEDGFRYGSSGEVGLEARLVGVTQLVTAFAPENNGLVNRIREGVKQNVAEIPAGILASFFARPKVSRALFQHAVGFEDLAYRRLFVAPPDIELELQSVLATALDFLGLDRADFLLGPTKRHFDIAGSPSREEGGPEGPAAEEEEPEETANRELFPLAEEAPETLD